MYIATRESKYQILVPKQEMSTINSSGVDNEYVILDQKKKLPANRTIERCDIIPLITYIQGINLGIMSSAGKKMKWWQSDNS